MKTHGDRERGGPRTQIRDRRPWTTRTLTGIRRTLLALTVLVAPFSIAADGDSAPTRLPSIALRESAGGPTDLAAWSDAPMVLNVWATWCAPCRKEMPALQALARRLEPHGIRVVLLSVDQDLNLMREFLLKYRIDLPSPNAATPSEVFEKLNAVALPVTYFVERGGRIVAKHLGARAWDGDEALQDVLSHLAPAKSR